MPQNHPLYSDRKTYGQRTPEDYIRQMRPEILAQLEPAVLAEVHRLLQEVIPRPAPKIVDLRFVVDLLVSRFYIVLLVGKDRRKAPRQPSSLDPITYMGNLVAVTILLLGFNLAISAMLLLGLYLLKSALGFNFFAGHFPELIRQLFRP